MTTNSDKFVLIVGAGPVGLSLAILLKQMEVPFRIIEKRTEVATYSRAFAIQSRTLEIFNQLKVIDAIKSNGRVNTMGVDVYKSGKLAFEVRLPPSESSEPYTVGLNQSKTEEILENRLKELGVTVEHGMDLKSLHINGDNLEYVELEHENKLIKIYPSYLVGCDGGKSLVRKLSGITFTGESVPIRITCIDAVVETEISKQPFGSVFYHDSRLVGLIWVDDITARIVIPNRQDEVDMNEEKALQIMRNNISPNEMNIKSIKWYNTFDINERRAETHYKGNIYLCGDAAHVHSPAGGQGMNTGIQDSYNLAWKLALIMKEVGQAKVLNETFHIERSAVAELVLKNSGSMMRRATLPPTLSTAIFLNFIFPFAMSCDSIRHGASNSLAEVFIKYNHNALIRNHNPGWVYNSEKPGVGLRLPSFDLFEATNDRLTTTHKVIKGGCCFEIFIYIPGNFLEKNSIDHLKTIVYLVVNSPVFLSFKQKASDSCPLHQISLLLATKMFQPNQWAHQLKGTPSVLELNKMFKTNPTYLDQDNAIGNYFGFTNNSISTFIVRPDGYVGASKPTSPESCQNHIETYFKRFITPDYF